MYCDSAGHSRVDRVLELTRELYNAALCDRRERWRLGRQRVTKFEQYRALTELRGEMPEMAEIGVSLMRKPLDRLDKAFQAFFRRAKAGESPGHPRFKGAGWWKSIGPLDVHAGMVKRAGNGRYNIRLKGLPTLRVKSNRELPDSENLVALRIKREGRKL